MISSYRKYQIIVLWIATIAFISFIIWKIDENNCLKNAENWEKSKVAAENKIDAEGNELENIKVDEKLTEKLIWSFAWEQAWVTASQNSLGLSDFNKSSEENRIRTEKNYRLGLEWAKKVKNDEYAVEFRENSVKNRARSYYIKEAEMLEEITRDSIKTRSEALSEANNWAAKIASSLAEYNFTKNNKAEVLAMCNKLEAQVKIATEREERLRKIENKIWAESLNKCAELYDLERNARAEINRLSADLQNSKRVSEGNKKIWEFNETIAKGWASQVAFWKKEAAKDYNYNMKYLEVESDFKSAERDLEKAAKNAKEAQLATNNIEEKLVLAKKNVDIVVSSRMEKVLLLRLNAFNAAQDWNSANILLHVANKKAKMAKQELSKWREIEKTEDFERKIWISKIVFALMLTLLVPLFFLIKIKTN